MIDVFSVLSIKLGHLNLGQLSVEMHWLVFDLFPVLILQVKKHSVFFFIYVLVKVLVISEWGICQGT